MISLFQGAKEGLQAATEVANVAIVSSANGAAVLDEWTRHELDCTCGCHAWSRSRHKSVLYWTIERSLALTTHVLMVGDAPGDLAAAEKNDVFYYPILVGKEKFSWDRFKNEALGKFIDGSFCW